MTDSGTPGLTDVQDLTATVTDGNEVPTIVSDGGGDDASLDVARPAGRVGRRLDDHLDGTADAAIAAAEPATFQQLSGSGCSKRTPAVSKRRILGVVDVLALVFLRNSRTSGIAAGSLFLGLDTAIGPVYAAYGLAEAWRRFSVEDCGYYGIYAYATAQVLRAAGESWTVEDEELLAYLEARAEQEAQAQA